MKGPSYKRAALGVLLATLLAACADPKAVSDIKGRSTRSRPSKKDILAKLDAIDKGQKDMATKVASAPRPAGPPAEDPNKVYTVPIGNAFAKGPDDAPVTIVEFSDFQCPFCAQAHDLVKQITDAYPKDVRFVFKNYPLPFHPNAMPAAKAAVAAGKQGKFFEMHDKLFENQRTLSPDLYEKTAKELGLDVDKFKKDMEAPETAQMIQQEMADAGKVDVRGTPTFFINGKKPQGRSFELYKQIIDEQIKAKKG
jgi:protein-disulfide isomerase